MNRFLLAFIFSILAFSVYADDEPSYAEEVEALGAVAGQGLACGATRYDDFEMLARALLITKAKSDSQQENGVYKYNEAKANAYFSKRMDGFYNCREINRRFDKQKIFDATLYEDGTIKTPDGKILTPRQPYDASLVYDENYNERERAKKIYDTHGNQKVEVKFKGENVSAPSDTSKAKTQSTTRKIEPLIVPSDTVGHIKRSK